MTAPGERFVCEMCGGERFIKLRSRCRWFGLRAPMLVARCTRCKHWHQWKPGHLIATDAGVVYNPHGPNWESVTLHWAV